MMLTGVQGYAAVIFVLFFVMSPARCETRGDPRTELLRSISRAPATSDVEQDDYFQLAHEIDATAGGWATIRPDVAAMGQAFRGGLFSQSSDWQSQQILKVSPVFTNCTVSGNSPNTVSCGVATGAPFVPVQQFGAAGLNSNAPGSMAVGSTTLSLTRVWDVLVGQGVLVPQAGHAAQSAPPAVSASVQGTPGTTSYSYAVSSVDALAGISAPTMVTVANGPAKLDKNGWIRLSVTVDGSAAGYIIWRQVGSGSSQFHGGGTAAVYNDRGNASHDEGVGSGQYRPWWVPSTPPTTAQNEWLVSSVVSGAGTQVLTLVDPSPKGTGGQVTVRHDDTAAFNRALASVGSNGNGKAATIYVSPGIYPVSSSLHFPYNDVTLYGQGNGSQINWNGVQDLFSIVGTSGSKVSNTTIENLDVLATSNALLGDAVHAVWTDRTDIQNLHFDHPYNGMSFTDSASVVLRSITVRRFSSRQGHILSFVNKSRRVSCCLYSNDLYGHSQGPTGGDVGTEQSAYLLDGTVFTIVARRWDSSAIAGSNIVIRNTGTGAAPQAVKISDFASEYASVHNIDLEAGQRISFSGAPTAHAAGHSNFVDCTSSAAVYIGPKVTKFTISGGYFQNASGAGVAVLGQQGVLEGANIFQNSASNVGGTQNTCPGVELGPTAAYVTVNGNVIGEPAKDWQAAPVQLDRGATNNVVTANIFASGSPRDLINNAGPGTLNVVANNGGGSAQ